MSRQEIEAANDVFFVSLSLALCPSLSLGLSLSLPVSLYLSPFLSLSAVLGFKVQGLFEGV